jgi:hypothetical protein
MSDYLNRILTAQFEAALAMMNQCVAACPDEHFEGKVANGTFRWVAYHALFFTDLYLTRDEHSFQLRDLHHRGGDEREPRMCPGLSRDETLQYLAICRQKAIDTLVSETPDSLAGDCGFSWRRFSRGELHIYSIRHIQHHTGQLSAFLRRVDDRFKDDPRSLPWIGSGWR